MKLFGKILLYTLGGLIVILVIAFAYFMIAFPAVGKPEDIKIEPTSQRIERGEYLFHNVSLCADCHSPRNWNLLTAPIDESRLGTGNTEDFTSKSGFPGDYYAPNLTPHHLKDWTDGEIFRAVTSGVSKDGRPLFALMPYMNFGKMSREDIYSIIAYLRSLPANGSDVPVSESKFPMSLIIKMMPKEPEFREIPDKSNSVKYGEYMITAASCGDCHTPMEKGQPIPGKEFAGGNEFMIPTGGVVRSANITGDKMTGIGSWSKEQFINRFTAYSDSTFQLSQVSKNQFNTIMPWTKYAGMKKEDLGAIYDYLMSIKPINNQIVKVEVKK